MGHCKLMVHCHVQHLTPGVCQARLLFQGTVDFLPHLQVLIKNFTRDGINAKIISLGATPGSSVTKKTDYLICGEKAGSKLAKAEQLGVKILTEQQFLEMLSA